MALRQLSASNIQRLMRKHQVTIRGLASRMNITQKRVREARAKGVTGECMALDWYEGITRQGLFAPKPADQAVKEQHA